MKNTRNRDILQLSAFLLAACAPDIARSPAVDAGAGEASMSDAAPFVAGRISTRRAGDALESTVDAQDNQVWVYVDLDRQAMAAEVMDGWDVAFQRFKVKTNGGVSGDGGVEVAVLDGVAFDAATATMAREWLRDAEDGPDANLDPDFALSAQREGWFDYDATNHTLSPKDRTYLLRSTERRVFKLRVEGYYDPAGSPGWMRFRWGVISSDR
jgi:hypothetical protein